LFLVTEKPQGQKCLFPLGHSGVLRDLDSLAADIAAGTGC